MLVVPVRRHGARDQQPTRSAKPIVSADWIENGGSGSGSMECRDCGTIHYAPTCRFCERLREELLERLEVDTEAVSLAVVAGWAVQGIEPPLERCWRVG
jgi:uncharacterized OB-fold protein